ncbi:hypothetical protein [Streptomyces rochei]
MLIKYTAAAALVPPEYLDLAYRPGGRYPRGFDQIELSLSHTGDVMAVGLSRIGRIGVDVEPAEGRTAGPARDAGLRHRPRPGNWPSCPKASGPPTHCACGP